MHQYRISKYDPKYRVSGAYTRDEWTSIADVGRSYRGVSFTMEEYKRVEQRHISFLCELAQRENAFPLTIQSLECHQASCQWQEGQEIASLELPALFRSILREDCWCKLVHQDFFIHFGYEYYLYTGCTHTQEAIGQLAAQHGLFAEAMPSPYLHDEPEYPNDLRPMTAIYLTRGDDILLLYRVGSRVVGNSYTGAAGGHMEPEELTCAKACVMRELKEETGLTEDDLENLSMRYITMRLKDGEVRQNYYFFAELKPGAEPSQSSEGTLRWFRIDALDDLPMPVTAKQVIRHYVAEGRNTDLLYGGISAADGAVFTPMTEF